VSCGKKGNPTLKSYEKPRPVASLSAIHREDEIRIGWTYPQSEQQKIKGFIIEKALAGREAFKKETVNFQRLALVDKDEMQFIDSDFKVGESYLYKVRTVSLKQVLSDGSLTRITPQELPPRPEHFTFRAFPDAIELSWSKTAEGVVCNIYKTAEKGNYGAVPVNKQPLSNNVFTDTLHMDKPVYYVVRALRLTDWKDEGYASDELEVAADAFIPSAPAGLQYAISDSGVFLTWNANPEQWVKGYRIYRKKALEDVFTVAGESHTPVFRDSEGLTHKVSYYVTARGPQREGGPSGVIDVSPHSER
jgi:hypothetical protein